MTSRRLRVGVFLSSASGLTCGCTLLAVSLASHFRCLSHPSSFLLASSSFSPSRSLCCCRQPPLINAALMYSLSRTKLCYSTLSTWRHVEHVPGFCRFVVLVGLCVLVVVVVAFVFVVLVVLVLLVVLVAALSLSSSPSSLSSSSSSLSSSSFSSSSLSLSSSSPSSLSSSSYMFMFTISCAAH